MRRSDERTTVMVDTLVSLRPGQQYLELEHTIHNTAEDHRMRVLFPSGAADAETYVADSQFDVVERPIALREDNYLYRELEVDAKPQQSWTAVYDEDGGLAVVSAGQLESAVLDQPEHPIAVTLFRSTHRTVNTEGETDGLLLGKVTVKQYVLPLDGKPSRVDLFHLAHYQTTGLRFHQIDAEAIKTLAYQREVNLEAKLPAENSLFALEGKVVLSSARIVDGSLEVRLFNPTRKTQKAALRFGDVMTPKQGWRVNLLSEPLSEPQALEEGVFFFAVNTKEIVTLRFS